MNFNVNSTDVWAYESLAIRDMAHLATVRQIGLHRDGIREPVRFSPDLDLVVV